MVRLLSVTCESLQATHEHVTWEKVGTRVVMQGTADLRVSRAPKGSHFSASTVKDETEGFPGRLSGNNAEGTGSIPDPGRFPLPRNH